MPLAITLALLSILQWPFGRSNLKTERHVVATWDVLVNRNLFENSYTCEVEKPHLRYKNGALLLKLDKDIDTSQAIYRINGGTIYRSRDDNFKLLRLGFNLHHDESPNASEGIVIIPVARVLNAQVVTVLADPSGRAMPRTFKVDGLAQAIDAAVNLGCFPSIN